MNIKSKNSLEFRLKILLRRESLVWLMRRGVEGVTCGWLLNCKPGTVLFKDKNQRHPQTICIDEIKACGIV
ncbi:MAG TPA: hypothetical protein VKX17_19525 [Planctomycetota bacterium]|nr:hypothetical protein [Planctomycetota bacterium]